MAIRAIIILVVCTFGTAYSQNGVAYSKNSLEIEPAFAFVASNEVDDRNFGAAQPLLQLNQRIGKIFEPHLRAGYLFTWSKTRGSMQGWIFGVGTRVYFGHLLIKNERVLKDFQIYGFLNYSIADHSPGGEEFFYPLDGFKDKIFRTGAGVLFPANRRFGTKLEVGYSRRSRSLVGVNGTVGATSLIYNF